MAAQNKGVLEKLLSQVKQAYQGGRPLIMVDTEEIELMQRLCKECGLVDLRGERDYDPKHYKYYSYVGDLPDALEKAKNFSSEPECLEMLCREGNAMGYPGDRMLVLLHLQKNNTCTQQLRKFVDSYVRCPVTDSALRSSCVLLYGAPSLLEEDLLPYTEILSVEYPRIWEIQQTVSRIARENERELDEEVALSIAELMVGFSLIQVEQYTRRLLWVDGKNGKPVIYDSQEREKIILDAKAMAIRSTGGLLTLYREEKEKQQKHPVPSGEGSESGAEQEDDLGGMEDYKKWAADAGKQMNNNNRYALDLGVPAMKGVLLCGVPGCGKSEAAKILHRQWDMPMLRMDVDQLMGGYVGDSERNMRQALALAEAMSPCILWIDEIEKGFSGAVSGGGDGGTFKRMFGRLLTWMQENRKPCFLFATANDISFLPPEFFRSGRFDALFAVYMPTNKECKEIFAEQMRRAEKLRSDTAANQGSSRKKTPLFDGDCYKEESLQRIMEYLTQENTGNVKFVSGADIQKITTTALKYVLAQEQLRVRGWDPDRDCPADPELWNSWGRKADPTEVWEKAVARMVPVSAKTWTNAVGEVIRNPAITTQGSSHANLDKIAACYVRLMRENFAPVSAENQQLFRKAHYLCKTVTDAQGTRIEASYDGSGKWDNAYDQALYDALKPRVETIATIMENNALRRICE